jgi:hypothetical protein
MKTPSILNAMAFILAVLGVVFRHQHWPGGKILIIISLMVLLLVLFRLNVKQHGKKMLLYIITSTLTIFIITLIFKMMHWPGAGVFSVISTLLVLVVSGILVFDKQQYDIPVQFFITIFIFILVLDGLLLNTGWTKLPAFRSSEPQISVGITPTKMNVLYLGIDNPVSVVIAGADYKKLEVKTDNGTISGENGNYIVHPEKNEIPANITLCADGKVIGTTTFRVKIVPEPTARLAGMSNGIIEKSLLLAQKGLEVELPNFDFDLKFKITQFTLVTTKNKMTTEAVSHSNEFSQDQLEVIKKLDNDQIIYFEDIKAVGPDGIERDLNALVFKVKL